MPGFFGIDILEHPNVDLVWDLEHFPYPLPDECASTVMASHLMEHINPSAGDPRVAPLIKALIAKKVFTPKEVEELIGEIEPGHIFIRFMDEIWRLLKPGGQFMMVFPYGGSDGYWQDPTHINGLSEVTFAYFDPLEKNSNGGLYRLYHPKPWKIEYQTWNTSQNVEICLAKRPLDRSYDK